MENTKTKALALDICKAASDKKAKDIMMIDISSMTIIADCFVICSGGSAAQVKAISDNIEIELKKKGISAQKVDGYTEARWIVLDYSDVLVHIFKDEDRMFYLLEQLWSNGKNTEYYT